MIFQKDCKINIWKIVIIKMCLSEGAKKITFYKTVTFGFEKKEEKSLWILVTYKKENDFMNVEYLWFYQIWTCIKITSRWWL